MEEYRPEVLPRLPLSTWIWIMMDSMCEFLSKIQISPELIFLALLLLLLAGPQEEASSLRAVPLDVKAGQRSSSSSSTPQP